MTTPIPDGPYLTKFIHKQEGLSAGDDDSLPPDSGFNALIDDFAHQCLIGVRPEGQPLSTTALAYPGTPDMRWRVTPWVGSALTVQVMMERSAGSGTFRVKVEFEAPDGSPFTAFIFTRSSSGIVGQMDTIDLTTFGGQDSRGMDGWLNVYMEVSSGGTTGILHGLMAMQQEDNSDNAHKLWK